MKAKQKIYYYRNKKIKCQGFTVKGKREGIWEYFSKSGLLEEEQEWKNGKQDGELLLK